MLPTKHLPAFPVTVYVLILISGPSVLFTLSRSVALGRRAALAKSAGGGVSLIALGGFLALTGRKR